MQEQLNEKISLLVDDELACDQAMSILKTMTTEPNLKSKLQRYQLISQVLKNEPCYILDSHFADKIHQQIRHEPIFFLPAQKSKTKWRKTGLAVAASILLAVVWIVGKLNKPETLSREPQMASAPVPAHLPANAVNPRFKDYLQAHDNLGYINNAPGVQPYARVVGYQQE
jgi:sigma-E factor negative regulatory protein RseA